MVGLVGRAVRPLHAARRADVRRLLSDNRQPARLLESEKNAAREALPPLRRARARAQRGGRPLASARQPRLSELSQKLLQGLRLVRQLYRRHGGACALQGGRRARTLRRRAQRQDVERPLGSDADTARRLRRADHVRRRQPRGAELPHGDEQLHGTAPGRGGDTGRPRREEPRRQLADALLRYGLLVHEPLLAARARPLGALLHARRHGARHTHGDARTRRLESPEPDGGP